MAEQETTDTLPDDSMPTMDNHASVMDGVSGIEDDTRDTKPNVPKQESTGLLIQYWVDRALNFFSNASNETLGACFVGVGASTYLVLGRVGLVLIGVVSGIALHSTWESGSGPAAGGSQISERERRRRELGVEVVNRVWQWQDHKKDLEQSEGQDGRLGAMRADVGKKLDFTDFEPETAAALDTFTSAVIRDYVQYVCPTYLLCASIDVVQLVVCTCATWRRDVSRRMSPNLDRIHTVTVVPPLAEETNRHVSRVCD